MIAISTMAKKPFNFDFWLDYHFSLDIDFIFLRIEDSPEIEILCEKYGDKLIVEFANNVNDEFADWPEKSNLQMKRQSEFVNRITKKCISLGIEWLAHIDSDELIWSSRSLKDTLSTVDKKYDYINIRNYEALYNSDSSQNPFVETNHFIRKNKLAYSNGKSIGRVSDRLFTKGPHTFDGLEKEISPNLLLILHFESPTFDIWFRKFSQKNKQVSSTDLDCLEFSFYKDSILLIQKGDLEECRKYYNKMRVLSNYKGEILKLFWTPILKEKNSTWTIQ